MEKNSRRYRCNCKFKDCHVTKHFGKYYRKCEDSQGCKNCYYKKCKSKNMFSQFVKQLTENCCLYLFIRTKDFVVVLKPILVTWAILCNLTAYVGNIGNFCGISNKFLGLNFPNMFLALKICKFLKVYICWLYVLIRIG